MYRTNRSMRVQTVATRIALQMRDHYTSHKKPNIGIEYLREPLPVNIYCMQNGDSNVANNMLNFLERNYCQFGQNLIQKWTTLIIPIMMKISNGNIYND